MFENIIAYEDITQHWKNLIQDNTVPAGLCISGQTCAGKCSCALELSRGILCQDKGSWNCRCTNCIYMRLLEHENVLMLGTRNFLPEIYCAQSMVEQHHDMQTHMFFYRALAKLVRRADTMLWTGTVAWTREIKAAVASVYEAMTECRDMCFEYAKVFCGTEEEKKTYAHALKKTLSEKKRKTIVKHAEKLYETMPAYLYPVQMLRNVISWANIKSHGNAKIVILESADMLHESSSNILLKILEEPPENVFFIFLTSHVSSLLPTIVSRLRSYVLPTRSIEEEKHVIEKVFRSSDAQFHMNSVSDFLNTFTKKENTEKNKIAAEHYLHASIQQKPFSALVEFLQEYTSAQKTKMFLEKFQALLQSHVLHTAVPPQVIQSFAKACAQTMHNVNMRNVSPSTALEVLYYRLAQKAQAYEYEKFLTHSAQ